MFATPDQMPRLPQFDTSKALIIIGMQNDAFYVNDNFFFIKNRDILSRLKEMIPYFRKHGHIIWVLSEWGTLPSGQSKEGIMEGEGSADATADGQTRQEEVSNLEAASKPAIVNSLSNDVVGTVPVPFPSSKARDIAAHQSPESRAQTRAIDLQPFDDESNVLAEQLSKPPKGQQPHFFITGTKGAEICDELKPLMEAKDMIFTTHFYSAFDQTSLLMALRMRLCMEIYLCGCFTNTSIYSTTADAVQHGIRAMIVEDCVGYRNERLHQDALLSMANDLGADGVVSEAVIEECGGREIPDSETPGITLEELRDLSKAAKKQTSAAAHANPTSSKQPPVPRSGPEATSPRQLKRQKPLLTMSQRGSTPGNLAKPGEEKPHNQKRPSISPEVLGPGSKIGSGDSKIIYDALDSELAIDAFDKLKGEIDWRKMLHRDGEVPRLVAVQGDIGTDGSVPIYRHPSDKSPPLLQFSPTVSRIRDEVEKLLQGRFNHALIQLYRSGEDNISEHADKTLDIVRGSYIINVSIGAQRNMTLRKKRGDGSQAVDKVRPLQRIKLPHNSAFVLGSETNREWLHGVRPDKRSLKEKTEEELSFDGERISITFRLIGTFIHEKAGRIWGSGATSKTKPDARRISTNESEAEKMISAFGKENHDPQFEWETFYGAGFDVVNLVTQPVKLDLCVDPVANMRVRLALSYKAIVYESTNASSVGASVSSTTPWTHDLSNLEKPILREHHHAPGEELEGDLTILLHLENQHPSAVMEGTEGVTAAQLYRCTAQSNELLRLWREMLSLSPPHSPTQPHQLEQPVTPNSPFQKEIQQVLQGWEDYLQGKAYSFVAGEAWTILDCVFWPVLHEVLSHERSPSPILFPALTKYHQHGIKKAKEANAMEED